MRTEKKVKWAIFYSGWGRTAGVLKGLFEKKVFPNAILDSLVIAGQDSPLTVQSKKEGYHIINLNPGDYASRKQWQNDLKKELQERGIALIFLCGFKYRIHDILLNAYPNRIANIHPALLPSFKNTQHAIQDAMDLGVKITGVTTHLIDENIDEGIIIHQHAIDIENLTFEDIDKKMIKACPIVVGATVNKIMHMYEQGQI